MRTLVLIFHIVLLTLAFAYGALLSSFGLFLVGISLSFWGGAFFDSLLATLFSAATLATGLLVCKLSARRIIGYDRMQQVSRDAASDSQ